MSDSERSDLTFEAIVAGRRSVRRYTDDAVPRDDLLALLDAARWAPSPHGRQPWRFAVLTNDAPKQRLAEAMGDEWRRQLALDGEPDATVQRRLDLSRLRIRSAPAIVVPCLYLDELDQYPDAARADAERLMAVQSVGAAIQNMLLAAYRRGLDSGWMCAPLFCPDVVVGALGIDVRLIPQALITIGYAAAPPPRRPHRPAEELTVLFD